MNTKSYETHRHEDPDFPIIFHLQERHSQCRDPFLHWHESLELLYFVEGRGIVMDDGVGVSASEGDVVVINSNHLHEIQAETSVCHYYCLIVDKELCDAFRIPAGDLLLNVQAGDEYTRGLFGRIISEMQNKQEYYKQAVKAAALELLIHLARHYVQQEPAAGGSTGKRMAMVKEAVRYIQLNYKEPLTLLELADHVEFSKYYFCRVFREVTGYSAVEYINFLRCQNARKLLKSGSYNVGQSAAINGFQNLSYFSRTYKKQFGRLPSEENEPISI